VAPLALRPGTIAEVPEREVDEGRGDHPHVAESLREALRYRIAGTLPVPGAPWPDQPAPFTSLVSQLMVAGIIDVGFAREETLRQVPGTILEGVARMLGGKG